MLIRDAIADLILSTITEHKYRLIDYSSDSRLVEKSIHIHRADGLVQPRQNLKGPVGVLEVYNDESPVYELSFRFNAYLIASDNINYNHKHHVLELKNGLILYTQNGFSREQYLICDPTFPDNMIQKLKSFL